MRNPMQLAISMHVQNVLTMDNSGWNSSESHVKNTANSKFQISVYRMLRNSLRGNR